MRNFATPILAAALALAGPSGAFAADAATSTGARLPGNLVFKAGGMSGRFIVLETWTARSWPANTLLKYQDNVWVTLAAATSTQVPGTDATWKQVTGATSAGTGGNPVASGAFTASTATLVLTLQDSTTVSIPFDLRGTATPQNVVTGAGSAGSASLLARQDHVHGGDSQRTLATAAPENVVTGTGSVGTSTDVARADHVHGGDQVGQAGSGLQSVATDNSLDGDGTGGDPLAVERSTTVPNLVTTGTGSVGTSDASARADHTHGGKTVDTNRAVGSAVPDTVAADTGNSGSSGVGARADHDHGLAATVTARLLPDGPTDNQFAQYDSASSAWENVDFPSIPGAPASWALASGATGTAPPARLPGFTVHVESGSQTYDPTAGVFEFAVDGTLRDGDFIVFDAPANLGSDSSINLQVNINTTGNRILRDREENQINETHLEASAWYIIQRHSGSYVVLTSLEDARTLATAAPENVVTGTGSVGTSSAVARADHVHGGDQVGQAGSGLQSVATDNSLTGDGTSGSPIGVSYGTTAPADVGTAAVGSAVTASRSDHVHGGGGGASLSDATPQAVGTAAAGSGTSASRDDHVHAGRAFRTTIPLQTGTGAGAPGSATTVARGDHDHSLDTTTVTPRLCPLPSGGSAGQACVRNAGGTAYELTNVQNEAEIQLIDSLNDVTYTQADTADLSSRFGGQAAYVADIDAEGAADLEINDMLIFQWRDNPSGVPGTRALGIRINETGQTLPIRVVDPLTNALVNKTAADLTRYEFLFLTRQDGGVYIQVSSLALNAVMQRLVPTGGTAGQVLTKDSATDNDVSWTTVTGGASLSDTTPVNSGTASAGTATTASRGDHDHGITAGTGGTFVGLSDTPGDFTNAALQFTRVNATETAIEYVAEPANQNTIPHVGRIPAVTPTSPDLVFLTHDELDGVRDDATLTIGRDGGNSCGYSDGSVYSPAFGSIDEPSPITSIFGIWNATDSNCDLSEVYTTNEGWLDDQSTIRGTVSGTAFTCNLGTRLQRNGQFAKRFTSCGALEDLPTGDITINFFTADATPEPYWTDGSVMNPAGLYEKVGTPPAYHDIRPIEESHRAGMGSFACGDTEPPDDGGQVCIDSDGRASFSSDRTVLVEQEPEITAMTEFTSNYWQGGTADVIGFANTKDNGQIAWYTAGDFFLQNQGTRASGMITITGNPGFAVPSGTQFERDGVGITFIRTAADATIGGAGTVVVAAEASSPGSTGNNIPTTATFSPDPPLAGVTSATLNAAFTGGTGSGIVGVGWEEAWTYIATVDGSDSVADQAIHEALRDNSVFLGEFSQQQDAAEDRDGYTVTTDRYFYLLHGSEDDLQEITGFTAGISEERSEHDWRGPVVTIEDVHDIFEANSGEAVTHVLDDFRVGDNVYSVIVRPDPTSGALRAPTAADYNATDARSRVVAVVDGKPYKVRRTLEPGHTATGTFTAIASGTSLAAGGSGTFRFRGVHDRDQDIGSPEEDDIYYNVQYHHWRVRDHDPAYGNYWYTLPNGGEILTRLMWAGFYTSQIEALGHVSRTGQRVVFPQGSSWALYEVATFTAPQPAHYAYSWTEAVPVPVPPSNVTLVDDVSLEWASADKPSVEVEFSQALEESDDDRLFLVDYRPNAAGSETRAFGGAILAEHVRNLTTLRPLMLDKTGGGRTPIDRTVDISNSPGSVEFSFPLSTGGNALRWMRIHYIGDHIDDVDGSFSLSATTITLDDSAGITTGANYWMVGPVTGAGCPVTRHSEKVTVTAVGTPNPHDITVVRGVDGTALDDVNCVSFASGADFILDDKTTFTLVPSADAQDSGDFTFTLLALGAGGSGGTGNTDITIGVRTADAFSIQSSSGDDAVAPAATASLAGIMTAADKGKLDGIATDATRCTVHTTYSTADTYTACDTVVLTQAQYSAIATPTAGVIYKIRAP